MSFRRKSSRVLLVLALLVGVAAGARASLVQSKGGAREILAGSLASETFEPLVVRSALEGLGPDAVSELFDVLAEGSVSSGGASWPLDRGHELVVLGALARISAADLRAYLESLVDTGADAGRRKAALAVLARCGTADDLSLAARLGPRSSEQGVVERDVREAFRETCDRLLRRQPEELERFAALAPRIHPSLMSVVVGRLASDRSPLRARLLTGLLGSVKEADALLLTEIEKVAADPAVELMEKDLAKLRAYLWHGDTTLVRCAILALAAAGDEETVSELVDLLESRDGNLRKAAHDALVTLTRADLGWKRDAWAAWLDDELAWWVRGADRCRATIENGSPELATQAIRVVGRRQTYPGRVVDLLTAGLQRDEPELVALTCKVLGSMGDDRALPALFERTAHPDDAVRAAAFEAMRKITNLAFPDDPTMWKRRLSPADSEDANDEE